MKKFIRNISAIVALTASLVSCNSEPEGITDTMHLDQHYSVEIRELVPGGMQYCAFADFVVPQILTPIQLPAGAWVSANGVQLDWLRTDDFNYGLIFEKGRPSAVTFLLHKNKYESFTNKVDLTDAPHCSVDLQADAELKMDTPYKYEFDGPEGTTLDIQLVMTVTIPGLEATRYRIDFNKEDKTFCISSINANIIKEGSYYLYAIAEKSYSLQETDENASGWIKVMYIYCQTVRLTK